MLPVFLTLACSTPPSVQVAQHQEAGLEKHASDKEFHKAHTLRPDSDGTLSGKDIEFAVNDGKAKAYWKAPKSGQSQVVLMIHEWWGLNKNIRETADKLSEATGYGVFAVDLYSGKVATTQDDAAKYMQAVDQRLASATVNAALRLIKKGVDGGGPASKIGTIGYCFGGGWSHKAAIMGGENVQACVIYYGQPSTAPGELDRLSAPVFMVWPNKDKWINKDMVDGFKAAMQTAGKSLEVSEFTADHAFANPSSQSYQSEDAKKAWDQTLAFFKKNLG